LPHHLQLDINPLDLFETKNPDLTVEEQNYIAAYIQFCGSLTNQKPALNICPDRMNQTS
jgi:hypothetical protein